MPISNLQLTPQFVQAVRDAVDIVEVASGYTKLTRAGRKWKGLCPLHKEKTPSFNVDADLGFFKCFGCGAGGDAIKLHMLLTGDDFATAMESLASRFGVPLPTRAAAHRGARAGRESERDPEAVLEAAAGWFQGELARSDFARGYLERRRIPRELVERYGLGYAPEGWRNLLQAFAGKFAIGDLIDVGLAGRPEGGGEPYDRFRHRLIFPIRNAAGRLVGFGGRTLGDDVAKYVNTAETERFRKGTLLYGLDQAKRAIRDGRRAFLVEGYVDALAAVAAGIDTAVASMGTALTPEQAKLLARFADEVVVGYDADEAGETASRRSLAVLLPQGLGVRRARLPAGEDPDSVRTKQGEGALRTLYDQAEDLVLLELDRLAPADLHRNPHGRGRASKGVTELLGGIPDSIVRYGYARAAAERLGVPAQLLWQRLGLTREGLERDMTTVAPVVASAGQGREREALRILLQELTRGRPLELAEPLPPPEAFRDLALRELFSVFLVLVREREGAPTLREIEQRATGIADASAVLADLLVESEDSPSPSRLGEALRDLRLRWAKDRRNDLIRLLGEAERRQDREKFELLLAEKKLLERELFPTAPNAG
jgi:DNA primase